MGWDGKVERKVEMESWRRRGVGQQQSWIEIRIQRGNEIQVFFSFILPSFETIDNFSIDSIRLDGRGEGREGEENWRESILELVGSLIEERDLRAFDSFGCESCPKEASFPVFMAGRT